MEIQFQVEESEQQLQSDMIATRKSIAAKKRSLEIAKNAFPLNSKFIIDTQVELEGLEEGLKRLTALKTELF